MSDQALLVPRAIAPLRADGTLADRGLGEQLALVTSWLAAAAGSGQHARAA